VEQKSPQRGRSGKPRNGEDATVSLVHSSNPLNRIETLLGSRKRFVNPELRLRSDSITINRKLSGVGQEGTSKFCAVKGQEIGCESVHIFESHQFVTVKQFIESIAILRDFKHISLMANGR
jgi:hypothetical protein